MRHENKGLMMKITKFVLGICTLLISPSCTNIAYANDPTLLIMAEDMNSDIGRHYRISTRILNEIYTQLDMKGLDVYDETAITVGTHVQGRSFRGDAELIDIAKSIQRPPIDVVVFFQVFYNLNIKPYQRELRLRIVGRLLNVQDGRKLGNWEAKLPIHKDQTYLLPTACFSSNNHINKGCILEAVGDDARVLAQEVGAIISEKLVARITVDGKNENKQKKVAGWSGWYRASHKELRFIVVKSHIYDREDLFFSAICPYHEKSSHGMKNQRTDFTDTPNRWTRLMTRPVFL